MKPGAGLSSGAGRHRIAVAAQITWNSVFVIERPGLIVAN
jgi:hypothetical protein